MVEIEKNITLEEYKQNILEWIEESKNTVEKGLKVVEWGLETKFEQIDFENNENYYVIQGGSDGGIDAALFVPSDEENQQNTWYVIQGKHNTAFEEKYVDSEVLHFAKGLLGINDKLNQNVKPVFEKLKTFIKIANESDKIIFVFATTKEKIKNELYSYIETIEENLILYLKKELLKQNINMKCNIDIQIFSLEDAYNIISKEPKSINRYVIPIQIKAEQLSHDFYAGTISLYNLYQFMRDYKNKSHNLELLFEKNVRRFFGVTNRINKKIHDTILSYDEVRNFGLYNNGITFIVDDIREENGKFILTNPNIVNGCQTSNSIYTALESRLNAGIPIDMSNNLELTNWKTSIQDTHVLLKIVSLKQYQTEKEKEKITRLITQYSNTQTKVNSIDLTFLEEKINKIILDTNQKYTIYIDAKRGMKVSKQDIEEKYNNAYIQYIDVAQAYAAIYFGEPGGAMSTKSRVAIGGQYYEKICDTLTPTRLFTAYHIIKTGDALGYGRSGFGWGKDAGHKQTRFIFYYTIKKVLDKLIRLSEFVDKTDKDLFTIIYLNLVDSEEIKIMLMLADAITIKYQSPQEQYNMYEDYKISSADYNVDRNAALKNSELCKGLNYNNRLDLMFSAYEEFHSEELQQLKNKIEEIIKEETEKF